jgi:hypothetical protein
MLDVATLPETRSAELRALTVGEGAAHIDWRRPPARRGVHVQRDRRPRGDCPGWTQRALNRAAWTLGRWIAAGALEQTDVEDQLYAAAVLNGLVRDDSNRQCWATIRSGLSAGLQEPIDLVAGRA